MIDYYIDLIKTEKARENPDWEAIKEWTRLAAEEEYGVQEVMDATPELAQMDANFHPAADHGYVEALEEVIAEKEEGK